MSIQDPPTAALANLVTDGLQYEHRGGGAPPPIRQMTIKAADGITYQVITAKPYTYNGLERVSYTVKRPRGRRTYVVIGYENGTFSSAA